MFFQCLFHRNPPLFLLPGRIFLPGGSHFTFYFYMEKRRFPYPENPLRTGSPLT
ncbi:hypothetical protein COPCOM_00675 [Coprococcus comes ATCC 27758]|uniref:Uncharacterized protein n=1 Tax=Coprococcus comes ATCC 27758 TaxID=470146 RepID=C0B6A2_9FIRM|nr:hypothetical protein COPCOM_00675 [Coprococcus comes ATCC 27758]